MVGYDARATIEAVLAKELASVPIFQGAKLELNRDGWLRETDIAAILDGARTDAVLVVKIRYWLSPKFDRIEVLALAAIYPTKAAADTELKTLSRQPSIVDFQPCPALYRNRFRASFPVPNGGGIADWAADNGAAAKAAIDTGIADIARMLAWDLDQPGPTGSTYDAPGVKAAVYHDLGTDRAWHVIDTKHGRTWLRARTGELMTIPEAKPDVAPATAEGNN